MKVTDQWNLRIGKGIWIIQPIELFMRGTGLSRTINGRLVIEKRGFRVEAFFLLRFLFLDLQLYEENEIIYNLSTVIVFLSNIFYFILFCCFCHYCGGGDLNLIDFQRY